MEGKEELILMSSVLKLSFYLQFNIFCDAERFSGTQGAGKNILREERFIF